MKKLCVIVFVCIATILMAGIFPPGGVSNFSDLDDAPSYTGNGGEVISIKDDASGLLSKPVTGDAGLIDITNNDTGISITLTGLKDVIGKTYGELTDYTAMSGYWLYEVVVDDDGSDETGIGTYAKPFKTIEKALSIIPKRFDLNDDELFHLSVNPGTYTYTPYYTSDTDYSFGGFSIKDFYGTGIFNLSLADGVNLQLTGTYNASITGNILSVSNCRIPVFINGASVGTTKLSFEMTDVGNNYHCGFITVRNSHVRLSNLTLENNNSYASGKTAYTYDMQVADGSTLETVDVVYTEGKEGTVTFRTDNTSIVETDGNLIGATALTRTYSTNVFVIKDDYVYPLVRNGFWLYDNDSDGEVMALSQIKNLNDMGLPRQVLSASTSSDTGIYLLDGARTTFYDLTLSGDCQAETVVFNDGKSPQDGDSLIIRVLASGDARTISFLESGDGTFKYGATLTSSDVTATETDKVDLIGCQWFDKLKRWLITAISKGF